MKRKCIVDRFPFISQILSPTGAVQVTEANYWSERACGIACVAMVLSRLAQIKEHLHQPCLWSLIQQALALDGYYKKGWKHDALLNLLERRGLVGQCIEERSLEALATRAEQSKIFIASVSTYFKGGERDVPGHVIAPGGHLVLLFGLREFENELFFCCHHPSSYGAWNRSDWWVPIDDLHRSFSGRFIEIEWGYQPRAAISESST